METLELKTAEFEMNMEMRCKGRCKGSCSCPKGHCKCKISEDYSLNLGEQDGIIPSSDSYQFRIAG